VRHAVELVGAAGMRPNAGHALSYANVGAVASIPNLRELHIGHAIVSRAVFVGLRAAVREMKDAMKDAMKHATKA
jgi:pyridoxine 5-phosphate synthase